jgi:hypothetical protein
MDDSNNRGSTDGRIEQAKDAALGSHDGPPSTADEIGEAAGGISGALFGAGIGTAAGPVGLLLGGIAGALGGWWAGRAVAEAAETLSENDESYYRHHYESLPDRPADGSYASVRGAYYLGEIASHNPNFLARGFDEVEPELERGWAAAHRGRDGSWTAARPYVREAYARGKERRAKERLVEQIAPNDRRE